MLDIAVEAVAGIVDIVVAAVAGIAVVAVPVVDIAGIVVAVVTDTDIKKTYCNQNVSHSNCCYSKYISYCIRSKYLPVETRISLVSNSCFDIGCPLNPFINPQLYFTKAIHLIFKSVRYMHLTCSAHYTVLRKRTYNTANLPVIYHAVFLK